MRLALFPRSALTLLLAFGGGLLVLSAHSASACSGFECSPDQFLPRNGTVPANLAALAWWPGRRDWGFAPTDADGGEQGPVTTTASDLRFVCEYWDGSTRAVPIEVDSHKLPAIIRLQAPLRPGESCRLTSSVLACDFTASSGPAARPAYDDSFLAGRAAFDVNEMAPLPAALGKLVTLPAARDWIELSQAAGCSFEVEACIVKAKIEFAVDAWHWSNVFVYETSVDGKPWVVQRSAPLPLEHGGSYLGRGRELLFYQQPDERQQADLRGLGRGRHSVMIRASLPGSDVMLATEPVEINLDCELPMADTAAPGDAGSSVAKDASIERDAAAPACDASFAPLESDAGPASMLPSSADSRKRSSSCSAVRVGSRRGMESLWLVGLYGVAVSLRRARRAISVVRA